MGLEYNLYSGLCAALNGVLLKSAFSPAPDGPILGTIIPFMQSTAEKGGISLLQNETLSQVYFKVESPVTFDFTPMLVLRLILHLLLTISALSVTGMMHFYFAKSMTEYGAAKATVYNFSINFLGTIFFGWAVFGE